MEYMFTVVLPYVIEFAGNREAISLVCKQWRQTILDNDRAILEAGFKKYPTRINSAGDTVLTKNIYDIIISAINVNDTNTVHKFLHVYTSYVPINWEYLHPYVIDRKVIGIYKSETYTLEYLKKKVLQGLTAEDMEDIISSKKLHLLEQLPSEISVYVDRALRVYSLSMCQEEYSPIPNVRYYLSWLDSRGILKEYPLLHGIFLDDVLEFSKVSVNRWKTHRKNWSSQFVLYREESGNQYTTEIRGKKVRRITEGCIQDGDILLIKSRTWLFDFILKSQAINIFKAYIAGGNFEYDFWLLTGPILKVIVEDPKAFRDLLNGIGRYGGDNLEENMECLNSLLDIVYDQKDIDECLEYAARYSYLGILDKYLNKDNMMRLVCQAHIETPDNNHQIDPRILSLIYNKGLQAKWIGFYTTRENYIFSAATNYKYILLEDHPDYENIVKKATEGIDTIDDHNRNIDMKMILNTAKAAIKLQKWRDEHNIVDNMPPPFSFWTELLYNAVASRWDIIPQIVRFHKKEITSEMLKNMQERYIKDKKGLPYLMEKLVDLGVSIDVVRGANMDVKKHLSLQG